MITRIAYSPKRTATIIYKDGGKTETEDLHNRDKWKGIWDKIYVKDDDERERASSIKEVQISVPAEILKVRNESYVYIDHDLN